MIEGGSKSTRHAKVEAIIANFAHNIKNTMISLLLFSLVLSSRVKTGFFHPSRQQQQKKAQMAKINFNGDIRMISNLNMDDDSILTLVHSAARSMFSLPSHHNL